VNRRKTEDAAIAVVALAILWILGGIVPHIFRRGPDEDGSRAGAILTALPFAAAAVALMIYARRTRRKPRSRGL
jgi:hypothetical protein